MIIFTEHLRYVYDLTPDSLVIDCGGFEGNFANLICEKYACAVIVFEPVPIFCRQVEATLKKWPKVIVFNLGIGGRSRMTPFEVKGSMTGIASIGRERVVVNIRDIIEVLEEFGEKFNTNSVDLLKLNIEGAEYETLERLLSAGAQTRFKNIQVQFHSVVPDSRVRRAAIMERMEKTHDITWEDPQFDIGWINWRLK